MTREERDRIIILEEKFKHLDGKVDLIGTKVDALDVKMNTLILATNSRTQFERGARANYFGKRDYADGHAVGQLQLRSKVRG